MENEQQYKAYFKELVLRIQIALAIAIIRTTPPGVTVKEHVRSIQARYKLKSLSTEQKGALSKHEQEVLYLQQKQLLSRLWRVTQKDAAGLANMAAEHSPENGRCTSESQETLVESDVDETTEQNIEPNLQFIQAIAHLTSIVNSFSLISKEEYQKILSSATNHVMTKSSPEKDIYVGGSSAGQDAVHFKEGTCVSSDMVKYVMHSSNGRQILLHSVQCVLLYLGQSINVENETQLQKIVASWKGSLLEYAVKVILELLDCASGEDEQNTYHQMCLDFIKSVINGILQSDALYKHQMWEQMCAVVLEVGKNKYICFKMIEYLIELVKCMNENLKSNHNTSKDHFRSLDIEKSFYLFYLLEHFIKNWKNLCQSHKTLASISGTSSRNSNSCGSITDLWRRKWCDTTIIKQENTNNNEEKDIVLTWKDVLQDSQMSCKEQYPLIMAYLFECNSLLESVDEWL